MILGEDYAPVRKYGVPHIRDGQGAYELFWEEEQRRIANGYTPPGGEYVPGPYYFYLNYGTIRGFPRPGMARPELMAPLYRDGDHELWLHTETSHRDGYGVIFPKGRRRGYSWQVVHRLLYEFVTSVNGQMAVGSQGEPNQGYVAEFREKFNIALDNLRPELRPSLGLDNNKDVLKTGWKEKVQDEWREFGLLNIIHWVNFANPGKLRGLQLSLGIWEEAGEIENLLKSFLDTQDCFKEGATMFGLPIIGGTSNKIRHDSIDFQEMCNNPEKYRLRPLFLDSLTCFYPMYDRVTGKSDREAAKKFHEEELDKRRSKEVGASSLAYWQYRQEYPQTWSDLWLTYGSTKFDLQLINDQIAHLSTNRKAAAMSERGDLVWPKDKDGKELEGQMPEWVPSETGKLERLAEPLHHLTNTAIIGFDPYFRDEEVNGPTSSDSKAACVVHRRYISPSVEGEMPAMIYHDRPYHREDAYMTAWKMAVYYGGRILAETGDDMFFKFFIDRGLMKLLYPRPNASDSPYAIAKNRFGVNMGPYQKRMGEGLADSQIKRNVANHRSIHLLKELAVYGTVNTDVAMAWMIALIGDYDMSTFIVREKEEDEQHSKLHLPTFVELNGKLMRAEDAVRQTMSEPRSVGTGLNIDRFNYGY